MKVKIRTTPLTQASTATAFKLATKSMSTDEFCFSKELYHLHFFSSKLQKAWVPAQEQIFHMVVRPFRPTGGKLWLELGTNVWCESGDQSWDQRRPGANFGTNSRLVSEARYWSFHPLWGKDTPMSYPSQIMTMDYKWLALAWSASSVMLLKLLKPKAFYGIRIHFTTYMFCNFWWNTKELYHHIFL